MPSVKYLNLNLSQAETELETIYIFGLFKKLVFEYNITFLVTQSALCSIIVINIILRYR